MKHLKRFLVGLATIGIIVCMAMGGLCFLGVLVVLLPVIIIALIGEMLYDVGEGIIG